MNLDELINRVISVAQASGEAKRQNALEIATLAAGTNKEVAAMNVDAHKYAADSHSKETEMTTGAQRYTADQHVRSEQLRSDSSLQAANLGLLGHVVSAGATAHSADVNAALPLIRGVAAIQGEKVNLPDGAPAEDQRIAKDRNAMLGRVEAAYTGNPIYAAGTTPYDARAVAAQGVNDLGMRSTTALKSAPGAPYGTQSAQAIPLATDRLRTPPFAQTSAPALSSTPSLRVAQPTAPSASPSAPQDQFGVLRQPKPKTSITQDPSRLSW